MTQIHRIAVACSLLTPFVMVIFALIELYFTTTGNDYTILLMIACRAATPLWFIYWISRVARKGKPLCMEIRYIG